MVAGPKSRRVDSRPNAFADTPSQGLGRSLQPWIEWPVPATLPRLQLLLLHRATEVQNVTSTDKTVRLQTKVSKSHVNAHSSEGDTFRGS